MSTTGSEAISDGLNIFFGLDERCSNHINSLLESEVNDIIFVFLSEDGNVNINSGEVHVLSVSKSTVVQNFDFNSILKLDISHEIINEISLNLSHKKLTSRISVTWHVSEPSAMRILFPTLTEV